MKKLKEHAQTIIALVAVVSIVLGAMAYFAKAEDVRLVSMRLDQKILNDRAQQIQEQIWTIKREYGESPHERKYKEEVERLEQKKKAIEKEIDNLGKK